MNVFLLIAVLFGLFIVSLNALALYEQLKHANPAPWIRPTDLAKLTAILSILFAIMLACSAMT